MAVNGGMKIPTYGQAETWAGRLGIPLRLLPQNWGTPPCNPLPAKEQAMNQDHKAPQTECPEAEIAVGSIVRLKSGGPKMTVCSIATFVNTQWFDGNDLRGGCFNKAVLCLAGEGGGIK